MMKHIPKLTALLIITTALVYADADVNTDAEFESSLNLGLTLTEGNSETILGNAALVSEGTFSSGSSLRAGVEGNYGESRIDDTRQTTVENVRGFTHYRKNVSKRWYAALNAAALYDKIAEIDYRAILGPALGGYLIRRDNLTLSAEIGPSYVWEKVSRESDDYLALRIAERLEYELSETAKIWQSAEFIPKTEDFEDFLVTAEVGVNSAMTSRMQLRVVLQLSHDSTPGADLEKNDFTLISGLGIRL